MPKVTASHRPIATGALTSHAGTEIIGTTNVVVKFAVACSATLGQIDRERSTKADDARASTMVTGTCVIVPCASAKAAAETNPDASAGHRHLSPRYRAPRNTSSSATGATAMVVRTVSHAGEDASAP